MGGAAHADELSRVIGGLYEAALDPSLWAGMANRLAGAFDSPSAVLKSYRADGEVDLLESTDNMKVAPRDRAWAEHWHRNDLWVERSAAFGTGRIIVGRDDLVPPAELEETGYYRDWLRRLAIYDVLGGVVRLDGGALGVLGIHRDRGGTEFGDAERQAAAILLPHIERALRIRRQLAPVAALAALAALERCGQAVVVLAGARRRVAFMNPAAERLLSRTGEIVIRSGRLCARDPRADARLAEAVAAALATAAGGLAPPSRGVQIPRAGTSPLIIVASPLPEGAAGGDEPSVLVLVRDPDAAAPGAALLRQVFGLTSAEAGVASALCRGAALPAIAAELGVGLSTVRSHLKSVMAKTHTSRQAELASVLLAGLGHLGGEGG